MEAPQLKCLSLHKCDLPGAAVAPLQARGTWCNKDIMNINNLLEWVSLIGGTNCCVSHCCLSHQLQSTRA